MMPQLTAAPERRMVTATHAGSDTVLSPTCTRFSIEREASSCDWTISILRIDSVVKRRRSQTHGMRGHPQRNIPPEKTMSQTPPAATSTAQQLSPSGSKPTAPGQQASQAKRPASGAPADPDAEERLDAVLNRVNRVLLGEAAEELLADEGTLRTGSDGTFMPAAPRTLQETGLLEGEVSALIVKLLLHMGAISGGKVAGHIGLTFAVVSVLLKQMKDDQLVAYKGAAAAGDYVYELTQKGRERAVSYSAASTYFGAAPVPLQQYIDSVSAQSLKRRQPSFKEIREAFSDIDLEESLLERIGQAIHSGRGMFLFGSPGNGKTSIGERVTKSFGDHIWIPRAITASGDIIRLYDPNSHHILEPGVGSTSYDQRWVKIRRPTVVVGGELQMENLEVRYISNTGVGESPVQLKSNCGTLLIDDFGRQRMSTDELLNRWIVPLEQHHDFLQLASGRVVKVPFDQLIIFSTNLEPSDLVDDAFLRRIPYKIEVRDPTVEQFVKVFLSSARGMGFECAPEQIEYLLNNYYLPIKRPMRFCQPRDLIRQIENRCTLLELPRVVTHEALDAAVENYFSIM